MESTLAGQTAPKEIMNEIKTRDPSGITRNHHRKDTGTPRLGKWQRLNLAVRNVLDTTEPRLASYSASNWRKKRTR